MNRDVPFSSGALLDRIKKGSSTILGAVRRTPWRPTASIERERFGRD